MAVAVPLIAAGIGAAGSALGGILGRGKESKLDKQKRYLIDELLASVHGNGPYSDLFRSSEADFQKAYVNPAKSIFRNQIAPQIQQSYIQSGQHAGTGLEDTLSRAGVELDELLNSQYLNYINQGNQNKLGVIGSILNQGNLSQNQSRSSGAGQGLSGFLQSDALGETLKSFNNRKRETDDAAIAGFGKPRRGFEND